MSHIVKSALIVPVYNESSRWNDNYWRLIQSAGISLFFVNDGSSDNTSQILAALEGSVILNLPKNLGKSEAVRIGMLHAANSGAGFNCIGFLDADGAFDTSEVISIADRACHYFDLGFMAVWTSRVKLSGRQIERAALRHIIGRIISSLLTSAYKPFPYDSQCGFKLYKCDQNLIDSLDFKSKTRWFFELEHFVNYFSSTKRILNIWEEPLHSWSEIPGSKIYSLGSFRILRELMVIYSKLRTLHHHSSLPVEK